eukprot:3380155-Rhodomonas_salina.2
MGSHNGASSLKVTPTSQEGPFLAAEAAWYKCSHALVPEARARYAYRCLRVSTTAATQIRAQGLGAYQVHGAVANVGNAGSSIPCMSVPEIT